MEVNFLPDPLLLMIFERLGERDLVSCSEVCTKWNLICQDQFLWRDLYKKQFNGNTIKTQSKGGAMKKEQDFVTWKEEYIRSRDQYPCYITQTLKGHEDHINYVEFSHDGFEVSSCSSDNHLIRWVKDTKDKFQVRDDVDMFSNYNWGEIYEFHYNPSNTKILIAGSNGIYEKAEIIIFSTGKSLEYLSKISFESFLIEGCWLYDDHFIIGGDNRSPDDELDTHHDLSLYLCKCIRSDGIGSGDIIRSKKLLKWRGSLYGFGLNGNGVQTYSKKTLSKDTSYMSDNLMCGETLIVFAYGTGFHQFQNIGFHQITMDRFESDSYSTEPDTMLEMNAEIIGMAISQKDELLYVHVHGNLDTTKYKSNLPEKKTHAKKENEYYVIRIINLQTFDEIGILDYYQDLPDPQRSELSLFMSRPNYLGISENFIAGSSEDSKVYIWDRNYGSLLTKLEPSKNLGSIESVAFNPKNEKMCIAAEDNDLLVWSSRKCKRTFRI